jgi:hypothetical protein
MFFLKVLTVTLVLVIVSVGFAARDSWRRRQRQWQR